MGQELIFRIDKGRWQQGLKNARAVGKYDGWLLVWRAPFTGDWSQAVERCNRNGWLIATVVDAEDRPLVWASPQFPKPGVTHYPCNEI